jgi:hypothetical protein
MRTWLRSVVNAILGKVPGKTSRPDTATRMAMGADFSDGPESTSSGPRPSRERDDLHLVKPVVPLADVNFQVLIRIVNEAQEPMPKMSAGCIIPCLAIGLSFFNRAGPHPATRLAAKSAPGNIYRPFKRLANGRLCFLGFLLDVRSQWGASLRI